MSNPKQWRNNGGQIEELRDDNWYYIAEVGEVNSQRLIDTERATLIAASPELLESLTEILQAFESTILKHDLLVPVQIAESIERAQKLIERTNKGEK